jgi:hypothetical protein
MYSRGPYSAIPYSALGITASSGTPFFQTDWPNPVRAKEAVVTQLTWTDSFKLPLQQDLPPHQTDWPVPTGPRRALDLITWVNPALFSVPPEVPNVMNYDWPNPRASGWPIDLRTWLQPLTPSAMAFVPELGRNQYNWPNPPLGRPPSTPYWTFSSTRLATAPPAEMPMARPRDWPNPRGPQHGNVLLSFHSVPMPPTPGVPSPADMLVNLSGRVRYLKNEVSRTRFLAKNPNT